MNIKCAKKPEPDAERRELRTENCSTITLKPDAAEDLPSSSLAGRDRHTADSGRHGDVFLRAFPGDECLEDDSRQDWLRHQANRQRVSIFPVRWEANALHYPGQRRKRIQTQRQCRTTQGQHYSL